MTKNVYFCRNTTQERTWSSSINLCLRLIAVGLILVGIHAADPAEANAGIFTNFSDLDQSDEFGLSPVFDPVGLLVGRDAAGNGFAAGSGVLIDPNWVLIAGHSTLNNATGESYQSLSFSTSPDTLNNLNSFTQADMIITYDGFQPGTPAGRGDDIALVRLINPITNVAAANRYYGQDVIGAELVMAGYGNPGVFPNEGNFDGIRRGGRNVVDSFGGRVGNVTVEEQYFVTDFDRTNGNSPLPLEWQASNVDSGGGWFFDVNGEYQLVGISNGRLTSNTNSFGLRTSEYNDWIDNTMAANSTTSVPEPGTLSLLTVGMIGVVLRRRRKVAR